MHSLFLWLLAVLHHLKVYVHLDLHRLCTLLNRVQGLVQGPDMLAHRLRILLGCLPLIVGEHWLCALLAIDGLRRCLVLVMARHHTLSLTQSRSHRVPQCLSASILVQSRLSPLLRERFLLHLWLLSHLCCRFTCL